MPFGLWAAVGVLWVASRRWTALRPTDGWAPRGEGSTTVWALAAVTVVGAAAALTVWLLSEPDLGPATVELAELARRSPTVSIVAFVLVFVTVNPVVEEVAYRNLAYDGEGRASGSGRGRRAGRDLRAPARGGFPSGAVGVVMSSVFGLVLGVIRALSRGLRVAILVHVVVNAVIAALVLVVVVPG